MVIATERLLADAQALIERPSENPPGDEILAGEYLLGRLRDLGADVEWQEIVPKRINAVGRFTFGPGPTLLFNSHLDVVPVDDRVQFSPEIRDGRLYGRGACDAKGSLAAMLHACEQLLSSDRPTRGTLIVAGVSDEEVAGLGTRWLVGAGGVRAEAAIVGEPTMNQVHLGCRGAYRARVRFFGHAVHSSDPSQGENAIYRAARFALAVEAWHARIAERPARPTVSATVIHGGSKVNIIPDACDVEVDRRLGPGEQVADGERELQACIDSLREADPRLRWSIEPIGTPKPSAQLDADHPLAQLALAMAEQVQGGFFRGGTDVPYLADAGIPAVILGPGSIDQAHTADEWVSVAELERAATLYERVARAFFQRGSEHV